jgi:glutamate-1-semialdehyde 2,1-aminomutase
MLTAFFCAGPVRDYATARQSDTARYARFFQAMLSRGMYLAPSQFEAAFVSLAHSEDDVDLAARAAAPAMVAAA